MDYLEIRFRPDQPGLRLAAESDDVVARAMALDDPSGRLARDVVYDWLIGADGQVLGVAMVVSPGDGVLEMAPGLTELPYIEYEEPFLRVWFTDRRDGNQRPDQDWAGAFLALPGGQAMAVVGTGHLTRPEELDDLARLCRIAGFAEPDAAADRGRHVGFSGLRVPRGDPGG